MLKLHSVEIYDVNWHHPKQQVFIQSTYVTNTQPWIQVLVSFHGQTAKHPPLSLYVSRRLIGLLAKV